MNDLERKKEIIQKLRPIDDAFFEVLMRDPATCQELLQIILDDPLLKVHKVIPQNSIKNLQGRSVRLDAYCTLGDGTSCNIEVQKENDDNHLKRVRYNASCITANITEPGEKFENVPTVYVIYITKFDMFRRGKTIYHVEKKLRETGDCIDDGLYEIFVNTCIDDGTTLAEYMKCFMQQNVNNPKFPNLTRMVRQYKEEEKGDGNMCDLIEEYAEERAQKAAEQAAKEAAKAAEDQMIRNLLKSGLSAEQIAQAAKKPIEYVKEIEAGIAKENIK